MARTKETCRKSTGGKAPRKKLPPHLQQPAMAFPVGQVYQSPQHQLGGVCVDALSLPLSALRAAVGSRGLPKRASRITLVKLHAALNSSFFPRPLLPTNEPVQSLSAPTDGHAQPAYHPPPIQPAHHAPPVSAFALAPAAQPTPQQPVGASSVPGLTHGLIRDHAAPGSFNKARHMLGSVSNLAVAVQGDGSHEVTARVQGSGYSTYHVEATFNSLDEELDASCSCPDSRGGICKHACAVLMSVSS